MATITGSVWRDELGRTLDERDRVIRAQGYREGLEAGLAWALKQDCEDPGCTWRLWAGRAHVREHGTLPGEEAGK